MTIKSKERTQIAFAAFFAAILIASQGAPSFASDDSTTTVSDTSSDHTLTSSTSSTQARGESTLKKILKKSNLILISNFNGPSIGSLTNSRIPDAYGIVSPGSKLTYFDSAFMYGYNLNEKGTVQAGFILPFAYIPVQGHDVSLANPSLRLVNTKLYNNGKGFNVNADIRIGLPTTNTAHNTDMITYLRSFQVWSYDIPDTRWTVGSMFSFRQYFLGNGPGASSPDNLVFDMYAYPNVEYRVLKNLGINAGYYMEADRYQGTDSFFDFTNGGTNMSVGLDWDLSPRLNLSPWIQFLPGQAVNTTSTSVGFWITGKII